MELGSILMIAGLIFGAYFLYLLFTQPQAALRFLGVIFMGIGRVLYFIAIGLFNFFSAIIRMFSRKK
jgi:uncharacterized protein YjeT (DUF2065 family)